jgi:hypothetical protein
MKEQVMGIKVDFEKKIIVNGREYHSWEEVPETVRRLGGSVLSPAGLPAGKQPVVFNGKEYEDITAMPEEERKMLETIMETVKGGGSAPVQDRIASKKQGGVQRALSLNSYRKRKPGSPSFYSTWLLRGVVVLVLLWGVYHLIN